MNAMPLVSVEAKPGSRLLFNATYADNELSVIINDDVVYDKATENDPKFNENLDFSNHLTRGKNSVLVLGINYGGPSHFAASLQLDGNTLGKWDVVSGDGGQGIVKSWRYDITVA